MKLVIERGEDTIPVREMNDGELAEIVEWPSKEYFGLIIQRHRDNLIPIGKGYADWWSYIPQEDDCRVHLLKPGDKIVIK